MSSELREKVRGLLAEALKPWEIDPEAIYINGVNNVIEQLVIDSRTVTLHVFEYVRENYIPEYTEDQSTWGFFSVAYSFESEHRVKGPDSREFTGIVTTIVQALG